MPLLYNGNVLTPLPPQEEELGVPVRPAQGGGAAAARWAAGRQLETPTPTAAPHLEGQSSLYGGGSGQKWGALEFSIRRFLDRK